MNAVREIGLMEDEAIDLVEAALLLAGLDHPERNPDADHVRIMDMLPQLIARCDNPAKPAMQALALSDLLHDEHGFDGDRDSYDAPANADLMQMLDRKRGLPITLSILYVALARHAGWQANILNVPGHVVVRLGLPPHSVMIDPFHAGRSIDEPGIRNLLARISGHAPQLTTADLAPLSNRAILVRLLSNQANRAVQADDLARGLVLYERMTLLAPSFTALWWERARIEQLLGYRKAARMSLAAMQETTHDAEIGARIHAALDALARSTH